MVQHKQYYVDAMRRGGLTQRIRQQAKAREIPALDSYAVDETPSGTRRHAIPPPAKPKSIRGDGLVVLLLIVWVAVCAGLTWLAKGCR